MHNINMLILQVFLQAPFVYVMWPSQNMFKLILQDRKLIKEYNNQKQIDRHSGHYRESRATSLSISMAS